MKVLVLSLLLAVACSPARKERHPASPTPPIEPAVPLPSVPLPLPPADMPMVPPASTPGCSGVPAAPGSPGASLSVGPDGGYHLSFVSPAFRFDGQLGAPMSELACAVGADQLGAYRSVSFRVGDEAPKQIEIRAYDRDPRVLFRETYLTSSAPSPFPIFGVSPALPYHLSYTEHEFGPYSFTVLTPDSPWLFFDDSGQAFMLSAASHFMNSILFRDASGALGASIDEVVGTIPAGFTEEALLVVGRGINATIDSWGHALTARSGKQRVRNDATVDLATLGYCTDNGSSYYYDFDPALGYAGTLLAVERAFQALGQKLGYLQLDSWWYPKGKAQRWNDKSSGEYMLTADGALFPDGLAAFQRRLDLPLVTHARWVDPASPYRSMYLMSSSVAIDPAFWRGVAGYLQESGVVTYEQDWLNQNALPRTDSLTAQDDFLGEMATAMDAGGLSMQYCMPLPRHYLQSTLYRNLTTTRVSGDHFTPDRWHEFIYGARLASAVGAWPWSDVFMSNEEGNLILATLSGGMVGVGDALGTTDAGKLSRAVRPDAVIVKPDETVWPLDSTFIADAEGAGAPPVVATYTDHGGLRTSYVFAFGQSSVHTASFTPAELGYEGPVYVMSYFRQHGELVDATAPYREELLGGKAFFTVAPVGRSGIAFLGDAGKYVSTGKQRISELVDDGAVSATLRFAEGEERVTLFGYAPVAPSATAFVGGVGPVQFDPDTSRWSVEVTAQAGTARVRLSER